MAFISIGVDYFQVLALFSRAKIKWPAVLKTLLNFFSIFNFNIDVTAPECLIPEFEYEYKWYVTMFLPIGCMAIVCIVWFFIVLKNVCYRHKRRWRDIASHSPMLLATMITLTYYMYLMLVRRIFDVYNCKENPVSPDGRLYAAFTSVRCDGGVCACWEWDDPNSIQIRLFYLTIPGIFLYMAGFPAYLLFVLKRNKKQIKEDQILRAHDLGDVESENPYSYFTRQRYHRIYYHFKPGKTYWMVYIVLRKFVIALVGVLFRENPGFQLSITMLLLFVCYLAQQKHRPYMSSMERKKVVAEHAAKVKAGNILHRTIAEHIQSAKANKSKRMKRESVRKRRVAQKKHDKVQAENGDVSESYKTHKWNSKKGMGGISLDTKLQEARAYKRSDGRGYFFDYNTVESFLLACAILVCLAGTMIESGNFTNTDGTDKTDIVWQRDLIGFLVTFLVLFSMVYYGVVFASELGIKVPKWLLRALANKRNITDVGQTFTRRSDVVGGIELSVNPLHGNKEKAMEIEKYKDLAESQANAQVMLLEKLRAAQLQKGSGEKVKRRADVSRPKKKKKKQQFKTFKSTTRAAARSTESRGLATAEDRDQVQWSVSPLSSDAQGHKTGNV